MSNANLTPLIFNAERVAFILAFKRLANAKQLTAADILLRAKLLGKDPRTGFTSITNDKKLANGAQADLGYARAIAALRCTHLNKDTQRENLAKAKLGLTLYPTNSGVISRHGECLARFESPLEITIRWGCAPDCPSDYSAGLSLSAFQSALRGL